ncbi:DUF1232 domain-containing protein [Luteimonas vadosa]|uniref:YkvA family protein n=1 Tax=Luteimonas vadosa TaxID=1165507 RepID=A0ABP9DSZ7_9GAMM
MSLPARLRDRARALKRQALLVWFAARDPGMPWGVRLLALAVAAYAFSPVDLIPDFIPVLGLLDDLVLVPLGVMLVVRLTPASVVARAQAQADTAADKPASRTAAAVVVVVWLGAIAWFAWAARGWWQAT